MVESGTERFVLKQSLGKLRVEQDWYSDRARIFRESAALRRLGKFLPEGVVPQILFEDRDNLFFAMTAAPIHAQTWKEQLLRGDISDDIAKQIGAILGTIIASTWRDPACEAEFGDQTVFDELRIDPYYRTTALQHPDLAGHIRELIAQSGQRRVSLVHGDWSPKNFLVADGRVMVIDFEVIHYGDPAFDAAFLLNHLLLKSFYRREWQPRYRSAAFSFWHALQRHVPAEADWFEPAVIRHLGALLLARVDGKSPAEYITDDNLKESIRRFARELIVSPPDRIEPVWERLLD
jgi:5-methylthioribose kinase